MAATYTHLNFGKDVFNKLDNQLQKSFICNLNLYYLFNQSFDYFNFYNFYFPLFGKNERAFAGKFHNKNANDYLKNIILTIKDCKPENKSMLLSYLYGSINHYILDYSIHPYIIYKCGEWNKSDKSTYKYNGLHANFEFMLDAFFYEHENKKLYSKIDIKKELLPDVIFPEEMIIALDKIYKDTFDYNNIGKKYYKAYKDSQKAFIILISDKKRIKKNIIKFFDILKTKRHLNIHNYSTNTNPVDASMFNLKREKWNHPCDMNLTYKTSLLDIYNDAVETSVKIIESIDKYFKGEEKLNNVLSLIGNNSYSSGFPLNNVKPFKYFEY